MGDGPNRPPVGPDFVSLSAAVRGVDKRADDGDDVEAIIAETVDPETAIYFASQRALRLIPHWDQLDPEVRAVISTLWIDGLLAGYRLAGSKRGRS